MRIAALVCLALVWASSLQAFVITPALIRGTEVPPGSWEEVVPITSKERPCTASIVGPRAILTAAHCAQQGGTVTFPYKGKTYSAVITRSSLYPSKDHDLSVGVLTEDVAGATPYIIGGTATVGSPITLLGYGCTSAPPKPTLDGKLQIGTSAIIGFSSLSMVSRTTDGAAICYNDDGGPAFLQKDGGYLLLGINSKGNTRDTNYSTRLDRPESIDFLNDAATKNAITICGINAKCDKTPPPGDPSCKLTANPSTVPVNGSLSLVLSATNATSASIDGTPVNVPDGEKRITPKSAGNFKATATVQNAAGKNATCDANYTVTRVPDPPEESIDCTLTALPQTVSIGETVALELRTTGPADYASIDGTAVQIPVGKITLSKSTKGDYSATGFVRKTGGARKNCFADYSVTDGTTPPSIASFSVSATHCGSNRFPQSGVQSACIAIINRDASWKEVLVDQAILLTNSDGTQEILPVLARKTILGSPTIGGKEDLTNYANKLIAGPLIVLDTRKATLTTAAGGVPTAIEGRGGMQSKPLFIVEKLQAFHVRKHLGLLQKR